MMKELRIEDFSPMSAAESKVWEIFDIIRNQLPSREYDVLLLILSGYKDGLFSGELLAGSTNIKEGIISSFYTSVTDQQTQYLKIIDCFRPSLGMIEKDTYSAILTKLEEIDKEILLENFSELFDDIIYRLALWQGKLGGEYIQPVELTRFMCGLIHLNEKAKVFNPFAGLASFKINVNKEHKYLGQEINKRTWALGTLRLMANESLINTEYLCDDSILNWPDQSERFDLIITNPPMGVHIGIPTHNKSIENFLIDNSLKSLTEGGKLIALLPQSWLFKNQEQPLKQFLINEDLIETIVSLPGGLLSNTGISSIILVISKSKKMPRKINFVNAHNFVTEDRLSKKRTLNDYKLSGIIHSSQPDSKIFQVVDIDQIRLNKYNLNVTRYFHKEVEGVKLRNLVELVKGQRKSFPNTGIVVRIKDLKNDKLDFLLDISNTEKLELINKPFLRKIDKSCLLLAIKWRSLKPTYFEYQGESIYISNDILALNVNEAVVDKAYLISELNAQYVEDQLDALRMQSSSIPFIKIDDLMELVVKLPTLIEQRAIVDDAYSSKFKYFQREQIVVAQEKSIEQFSEFASLKHTLGTPRQNILDWTDNLIDFFQRKQKQFDLLNKEFEKFYELDILAALSNIKRDINFITDVLEKGENGLILSEYKLQWISLFEINKLISELSDNHYKFKINKSLLSGENLIDKGIYANPILFKTLLDNILSNADKYGFDNKSIGNEVIIESTEIDNLLSIQIRNNGKPFPKNFYKDKFITKYSTTSSNGKGIGGYDINRIAAYFNNPDWVLSLNEDPLYPVKFKFEFSISVID